MTEKRKMPKSGVKYALVGLAFEKQTTLSGDTVMQPLCPSSLTLPSNDWIYVDGELTEIVCKRGDTIKVIEGKSVSVPILEELVVVNGYITAYKPHVWEFIEKSNFLKDNPNRNQDVPAVIERIDSHADKIEKSAKAKSIREAILLIEEMSERETEKFIEYALALGVSIHQDEDAERNIKAIVADMEEIAEKDPQGFIKGAESNMRTIKATIKKAESANIINYSTGVRKWFWTPTGEIVTVPEGQDAIQYFAGWLVKNEGNNVLDLLKEKLADAEKANKKPKK